MSGADAPPPIGSLRLRAQVQSRTLGQTSLGESPPTWSTIANVWCNVTPLSAREIWQAQQVQADVTHRVDMRYCAALGPACRILAGGMTLNVQAVTNPDGRQRFTKAICIQVVSN